MAAKLCQIESASRLYLAERQLRQLGFAYGQLTSCVKKEKARMDAI